MLEIVDRQEKALGAEEALKRVIGVLARHDRDRERPRDGRGHMLGAADAGKLDPADTVGELGFEHARHRQRESSLANPAGPRQRDEPNVGLLQQGGDRLHVWFTPDHPSRRNRQRAGASRGRSGSRRGVLGGVDRLRVAR